MDNPVETLAKLALEESAKAISQQAVAIAAIRQSCATFTTLSTVVATFLGKEVISRWHDASPLTPEFSSRFFAGVAIALLFLALISATGILQPRREWIFGSRSSVILANFLNDERTQLRVPLHEAYIVLSGFNEENCDANARRLHRMNRSLRTLFATIPLQIVAWLCALY